MMLNAEEFTAVQDSIMTKIEALGEQLKFDVFDTDIPVGTNRPNVEHAIVPYVLVDVGNRGQQSDYEQGITGTRDDLKYISVIFEAVSNNPRTTRQIVNYIDDEFMGWKAHETWGEFVNRVPAPLYVRQAPEGGEFYPPRYYKTVAYVVDVDA